MACGGPRNFLESRGTHVRKLFGTTAYSELCIVNCDYSGKMCLMETILVVISIPVSSLV